MVLLIVAACSKKSEPKPKSACIADDLPTLRNELDFDHACVETSCKEPCAKGDGLACAAYAYALEREGKSTEKQDAFLRACQLGIAVACTNAGAGIWIGTSNEVTLGCAMRFFEAACEAGETLGCGMTGRLRAELAKTDEQRSQARLYFESVCAKHGGGSCRMFAFHLDRGELGARDESLVRELMQRACDTGDDEACGHEMPDETFHGSEAAPSK